MKRHWIILLLLVLAHVVLDLVAWRLAAHQEVGSPPQILLIVLLRTQLSLLALYLALGTAHWALRLAALTMGVVVWTGAYHEYEFSTLGIARTATLFTVLALPLVLVGAIARVKGFLWGGLPERANGTLASRQFSLGAAFRWLTIAAILLGLAKMAKFPMELLDLWLRVSIINIFVAVAFLWAVATRGLKLPKLGLMVIVAILTTALLQDNIDQAWVAKFVLQALLMVGTAEVCRLAGWPLGKAENQMMNDELGERLAINQEMMSRQLRS